MRLAAVYIPSGVLPHIFGEEHKGYTLNIPGKYIYDLKDNGETTVIYNKFKNTNFIPKFWGENIDSVLAIVGKNGTGKSTILNVFRYRSFCKFVIEDENGENPEIWDDTINHFDILFYSPFLDIHNVNYEHNNFYDISKYSSMLDDVGYESSELSTLLELHNSENLKRWIKFRNIEDIQQKLMLIGLPIFDKIQIKLKYFSIDNHDTSYNFRPFFERFRSLKNEESERRYAKLKEEIGKFKSSKEERFFFNRVRLELYIIETIICKVHNILESSGNKYLDEGYLTSNITIESPEFKSINSLKDSFYWFLDNAFVQLTKNTAKICLPAEEVKVLLELLLKNLPDDIEIENWSEFYVDLDHANDIINAYEVFIKSFQRDFTYDRKAPLVFTPNVNLSSGEKGMYNLFSSLAEVEYKFNNGTQTIHHLFHKNETIAPRNIILLDEPEMGFHPQWKKKFISSVSAIFPCLFRDNQIQILFTTHDPLTLSDIPQNNIVYLDKSSGGLTFFKANKVRSFGANVHDLLADSFFLEDGFMGEFAQDWITDLINYLTLSSEQDDENNNPKRDWSESLAQQVINIVDEPLIKERLQNLFDEKFIHPDKRRIEAKIKELEIILKKQSNEED